MIMYYIIRIEARFRFIIWRAFKDSVARGTGPMNRARHSPYRSAGACPPRRCDKPRHGERVSPRCIWIPSDRSTPVGQDRQILTRSRSGDPELQKWARTMAPGTARDRPSPYGDKGGSLIYRSAGACPPRTFDRPKHGEGQALALRGRGPFCSQENLTAP